MNGISYVTIAWSVIAASALLIGLMHFSRWAIDRAARVDLTFSIVAFAFVGVAVTELGMMQAHTPEAWGLWVKWCHLPLAVMFIATVVFVSQYFGTGRAWLATLLIAVRLVILGANFAVEPNFNFMRIDSIAHIAFLGESVTVVGESEPSRWQFLGTLSTGLLAIYVLDAAYSLWRRGGADRRRRAVVIGGGVFLFVVLAGTYVQLVIWGVLSLPLLITPSFTLTLLAMAYELSRDSLRASAIARELEESRQRLELAAESADLGLCGWDSQTGRVWATQRAREIFGFSPDEELAPERWLAQFHPDDVELVKSEMQAALARDGEFSSEYRVCPPGLAMRWVATRGRSEYSIGGKLQRIRGVVRDVSGQRQAMHETQELRRELAHSSRVSVMGQLASSLAHELSQPLGAILRNTEAAEMLLRSPNPDVEELKAIVADIHRDDGRAGAVIDRLRSLLKRRQLDVQTVSPESLVSDVRSLLRADAVTRHVTIDWSIDASLPMVSGDRVQLSQVLINLIINAMDAVMDLSQSERRVSVLAQPSPKSGVEITVQDSGPGVPADAMTRIFDPFFTTKASGMGMGLSVCRTIVDAHGGTLSVENGRHGGAVFRVCLPAAGAA